MAISPVDNATSPSKRDSYCLSSITFDDFQASASQVHAMQDADRESKRYAVYLPAALGLFGLGTFLDEVPPSSPPSQPISSAVLSYPEVQAVVDRLRQRETMIHEAARSSLFVKNNGSSTASVASSVLSMDDGYVESLKVTRSLFGVDADPPRFIVNNSKAVESFSIMDLDARISAILKDKKYPTMIEATKSVTLSRLSRDHPCTRPRCKAILPDLRALVAHLYMHDVDGSTLYRCVGCEGRFENWPDADEHRNDCPWLIIERPPRSGVSSKPFFKFLRIAKLLK
ncbi:hypothetical protein BXZ70DRAFT_936289 [Cristinia sonorae]|uniref:Uncharacterized protein n=1 Tax=Cristinia sonorae TaxID=1940300 RepID=A0A8K0UQ09_9AGAR|nr:hypothetical protein BXZ70DRAFT_936289 [Cristinia sonorae]